MTPRILRTARTPFRGRCLVSEYLAQSCHRPEHRSVGGRFLQDAAETVFRVLLLVLQLVS